jgi:hypothetical protein
MCHPERASQASIGPELLSFVEMNEDKGTTMYKHHLATCGSLAWAQNRRCMCCMAIATIGHMAKKKKNADCNLPMHPPTLGTIRAASTGQ